MMGTEIMLEAEKYWISWHPGQVEAISCDFPGARGAAFGGVPVNRKNKVPRSGQGLKKSIRNRRLARVSESYQIESYCIGAL